MMAPVFSKTHLRSVAGLMLVGMLQCCIGTKPHPVIDNTWGVFPIYQAFWKHVTRISALYTGPRKLMPLMPESLLGKMS